MPQLKPETISMTGLNLFQHLCNLARLATSTYDGGSNSEVSLDSVFLLSEERENLLCLSTAVLILRTYWFENCLLV